MPTLRFTSSKSQVNATEVVVAAAAVATAGEGGAYLELMVCVEQLDEEFGRRVMFTWQDGAESVPHQVLPPEP